MTRAAAEEFLRLEEEFHQDMLNILEREKQVGGNSARFRQMLNRDRGLAVARKLLRPDIQLPKNTFTWLREINRLDLTMEHYVDAKKYASLFNDAERKIARWRLQSGD